MFNPIRTLARQMLASMFVMGGIDALRSPAAKAPVARDVTEPLREQISALDSLDDPDLVRINGGVQLAAGLLLAFGKLPRLSSLALAGSLVPTTLAAHRFWEEDDPETRSMQQIQFLKNLSMLGGLLLGALDTEGRPGIAWRTKHAAEHVGRRAGQAKREASLAADVAQEKAKRATAETRAAGRHVTKRARREAKLQAEKAGIRAELAKEKMKPDIGDAKRLVDAVRN